MLPHFLKRNIPIKPRAAVREWLTKLKTTIAESSSEDSVVVDITSVEDVNSRELNEIARIQLSLRDVGKTLVLKNAAPQVSDLFEMTRMNRVVEIYKRERQEAVS